MRYDTRREPVADDDSQVRASTEQWHEEDSGTAADHTVAEPGAGTETELTAETDGVRESETDGVPETDGVRDYETDSVPETDGMRESETDGVPETDGMRESETDGVPETDGMRESGAMQEATATPEPDGVPDTTATPAAARPAPAVHPEPIWSPAEAAQFQQRWQEVQLRFVDDPRSAAEEAANLLGEVVDQFSSAVATRRQQWDAWRTEGEPNGEATEQMRVAVRNYRHLLDRILAT